MRLCPKYARHIFITDRMSRDCAGPDHEPAAFSMGNSVQQWLRTYYPTFKLHQMKQAQMHMEQYRQQTLQQHGTASVDPMAVLAGVAAVAPPPPAEPEPGPAALAHQMHQMQQQQARFQAAVLQRLHGLQPSPSQAPPAHAAVPAPLPEVKAEPEWPEGPEDHDVVVILSSCSSGYGTPDSMSS